MGYKGQPKGQLIADDGAIVKVSDLNPAINCQDYALDAIVHFHAFRDFPCKGNIFYN